MNLKLTHHLRIVLNFILIVGVCSPALSDSFSTNVAQIMERQTADYKNEVPATLSADASFQDILNYGMMHNAELKAAFYRWKASSHQINQAGSLEDPNISFRTFINEVETRVGPQKQMFGISQKIPFPGKLETKADIATTASRQKYAEYEKVKLQYLYEVKDAYFEFWFLHKMILVTEKNMELLKHFEGVAQSRYKSNIGSNQDLLKAQLELGKLENDLLTFNDYKHPITARLNAVLNRPIDAFLEAPAELHHQIIPLDDQLILSVFYENNPDLENATLRIEENKKRVWLARLDYLPDFMIGYDYVHIDERPLTMMDNGKDASSLIFSANVPLWLGKQASRLEEAKSNQRFSEANKIQIENNLLAKIKMITYRIKDAQRQIQLYRDALVPKAEQSLKASEAAYSAGSVDFLNLIDSERSLLAFQLSYYKAIRDYEQRFAEIEMIVGQSLRGYIDEPSAK